ncbi:RmlC-like cupins superfamily protein [Tanacetum coccineum]
MPSKHHTISQIKSFHSYVSNHFQVKIKTIKIDNGTEFLNSTLKEFFQNNGIIHQTSYPNTPQQNARVERKHTQLLEIARALRFQANFPIHFLRYCILAATYIIYRLPSTSIDNKSPYEILYQKPPSLDHLRTIGYRAYIYSHTPDKFASRSIPAILIGYPLHQKGYLLYDPQTHKLHTSRHVTFDESQFLFQPTSPQPSFKTSPYVTTDPTTLPTFHKQPIFTNTQNNQPTSNTTFESISKQTTNTVDTTQIPLQEPYNSTSIPNTPQHESPSSSEPTLHSDSTHTSPQPESPPPIQPIRQSIRTKTILVTLKDFHHNLFKPHINAVSTNSKHHFTHYINYLNLHSTKHRYLINTINKMVEPHTYTHASKDPRWIDAMQKEIKDLENNHTWELTTWPANKSPIRCKWVYRIKYFADGALDKFKARLVAKGYTQTAGIDYKDTFAPVAKMVTVRALLTLAVHKN